MTDTSVTLRTVDRRDDSSAWWLLLILGLTALAAGVAMLVWPGVTARVMAVLLGIWLLVAGIARVLSAFWSGRGVGAQVLSGIVGLLLIAAGVACLRDLVKGLALLATIVALLWLFSGLSELVLAFAAQGATRVWMLVVGIASLLVGVAFLVWPKLSLGALVLITSISALVVGATEVVLAFQVRSARRAMAADRVSAAVP
jgi:uncharacterized membrane protein HdeD (DUF308 family)